MTKTQKLKPKNWNYEKVYYYLTMFYAFSIPVSKALISLNTILYILVWMLEGDFKRKYKEIRSSKILIFVVAFFIISAIGVLYSQDLDTAFRFLKKYSYLLAICIVATSIKKEWIKSIITLFLAGMLCIEIVALSPLVFDFGGAIEKSLIDTQYFNPSMLSIQYSVFLAFTAVVLLNRLLDLKKLDIKFGGYSLFFALTMLNLFLSHGRTGQLIFFASFVVLFFYRYRLNLKKTLTAFIVLAGIYIVAYSYVPIFNKVINSTKNELYSLQNNNFNTSNGRRLAYYPLSWDTIKDNFVFGVGLGDFKISFNETLEKEEFSYLLNAKKFLITNDPHNQYLLILLQTGLIGLSDFLYILYRSFRVLKKVTNREQKTIFFLFLIIYMTSLFTDTQLISQTTRTLWVLFIAMMATYEIKKLDYVKKETALSSS